MRQIDAEFRMQDPDDHRPSDVPQGRLQALFTLMHRHQKTVHSIEMVIFFLMILLELWGADLLLSWRGWAIVMFGTLFGISLTLRFGAAVLEPRPPRPQ